MFKSILILTMLNGTIVTKQLKVKYKGCKKIAKLFKQNKDIVSAKCKRINK